MKNLLILFISIVFSLFIGELLLRQFPVDDPYQAQKHPIIRNGYIRSQFKPNAAFKFRTEEGLPGFKNQITTFSTNEYGFRGDPITNDKYLIFAIGGSTTECLYLDDDQHWPFLLQQAFNTDKLQVNVQNAGKSGDSIDDHMAMITHRIAHLDPDMILIYFGINDLLRLICDNNPFKFDQQNDKLPVCRLFLSELQLFRRIHNVFTRNENKSQIAFTSDYSKKTAYIQDFPETDAVPVIDTSLFLRKLDLLSNICISTGANVVFIPQLTTWHTTDNELREWHWMTEICGKRYKRETMDSLMKQVNNLIVEAGQTHDIRILDLHLEPTPEFFYDDCHFNPAGSKAFTKILYDSLHNEVKASYEARIASGRN